jgi:hypothetical protein
MRPQIPSLVFLVLSCMLLVNVSAGQTLEGSITGRVSLTNQEGEVCYGDWVRVFLTKEPIHVPSVDLVSIEIPSERQSRINSGHMDFFVNFRQKQDDPGYVVENKLTRPDGTFAFYRIPAGRYYIVITFPTMIAGFKCAWQAAVDVVAGQNAPVELNNDNLAIPAY